MLKHVSNFFLQIFPSVVATVVGAYIVTNYINNRPAADAPKAAVASTPEPAKDTTPAKDAGSAATAAAKADAPADEAGKPKQAEKPAAEPKRQASREKPSEKPEKSVKAAPVPAVTSAPAQTVAVAPSAPAAVDSTPASDNRDANDLARAALDRLRGPVEAAKQPEPRRQAAPAPAPAARAPEQPKVAAATPAQPHVQQTVQPLPPATLVTAPNNGSGARSEEANAPKSREAAKDERSLTSFRPPAEIPGASPIDLHATGREPTSIADDVVATARSVFNAVIPR